MLNRTTWLLLGCAQLAFAQPEWRVSSTERLPEVVVDAEKVKVHTQGLYVTGQHYLVTGRLETKPKRPLLFRFKRRERNEYEVLALSSSQMTELSLDHPGGFDRDADGVYWIPVSTSHPRGPTVVLGLELQDSEALSASVIRHAFRFDDHLGAICCLVDGTLLAANWDTKCIYQLDKTGKISKRWAREQFLQDGEKWTLAVQDWKFLPKQNLLLASGIDKSPALETDASKALLLWIDLEKRSTVAAQRLEAHEDVSRPLTNEGMAVFKNELFLLPEDLGRSAKILKFRPAR